MEPTPEGDNHHDAASPRSSSRRTRRHTAKITISPTTFNVFHFLYTNTRLCCSIGWNLLTQPAFSTHMSLVRTSVVLVLCHYADLVLERHILIQQQELFAMKGDNNSSTMGPVPSLYYFYTNATSISSPSPYSSSLSLLHQYASWWMGAAIMVSGVLLILIIAALQQQQQQQPEEQWFLFVCLISLFCVEALLPLCVLGCASLYLIQQVSWTTVLLVLSVIWSALTLLAHCIRCRLFHNLQRQRRTVA